jgi:triosephosphate isomerase
MKYNKFSQLKQYHFVLKTDPFYNKLVFANWKMHFSLKEVLSFCQEIAADDSVKSKLILAAPTLYLSLIGYLFPKIVLAAQDVSCALGDSGAYTGEVSSYMLESIKVKYCLIGHYERRKFFAEDNEIILRKAKNCLRNKIIPVICFGEQNIGDDATLDLKILNDNFVDADKVVYAYEPYWSIGTGDFKFDVISSNIEKMTSYLSLPNKSIIYGGSVNSKNICLLNQLNLDGFLVGSASLKTDELFKIIKSI